MFRRLIMMAVLAAATSACATSGAVPRPFPGAVVASAPPAPAPPAAPVVPAAPASASDAAAGKPEPPVPAMGPDLRSFRYNGRAIAQFAMGFRGVPYRLGGADPGGFDCSGLVQYVFAQYGIAVPRVVEEQYDVGDTIKPSEIKPGDLIFFNTKKKGDGASHVAIAIGPDSFVHAPNSTGVVRVEHLGSAYWGARYLGARRIAAYNP